MSRTRYVKPARGYATVETRRAAPDLPADRPMLPAERQLTAEEMAASLADDDEFRAMVGAELRGRWSR